VIAKGLSEVEKGAKPLDPYGFQINKRKKGRGMYLIFREGVAGKGSFKCDTNIGGRG
jgi:hypothetical protein